VNVTPNFHAPDIECEHCAEAIKDALVRLEGVQEVEIDVVACTVCVDHDQAQVTVATLRAVLEEAGYPTSL
jgi:copper chaperone CopZ